MEVFWEAIPGKGSFEENGHLQKTESGSWRTGGGGQDKGDRRSTTCLLPQIPWRQGLLPSEWLPAQYFPSAKHSCQGKRPFPYANDAAVAFTATISNAI